MHLNLLDHQRLQVAQVEGIILPQAVALTVAILIVQLPVAHLTIDHLE